ILRKGVAGDWCEEHGVPESGCTICHPELAVKGKVPVADDAPHVTTEPAAKMPRDPKTCQTHVARVQFASAESVLKAGIRFSSVVERPMSQSIVVNAETDYDHTRVAQV